MNISFKNVGIVESADIELKGLTVITGLNDIGKSIISKSIFSIIKTIYRANELAIEDRNTSLQNVLQQISSLYRQITRTSTHTASNSNETIVFTSSYINAISSSLRGNALSTIEDAKRILLEFRTKSFQAIETNPTITNADVAKSQFSRLFDAADDLIKHEPINEDKYKTFFDEVVIRSIFQNQFNTEIEHALPAEIKIVEGNTELVDLKVENESTTYFKVLGETLYNEATLFESPYIVQLNDFTNIALAYLPQQVKNVRQSNLPYHVRDISLKMRSGMGLMDDNYLDAFAKTAAAIGGNVYHDPEENTIVFENLYGQKIKSFNIASGIKSFGMLQMYLTSGLANARSLLIIDEPEVHLHMKWQLAYAEIVCNLVKLGIPILISTHSPFFLEALTVFVKKLEIEQLVNIYNGSKSENGRTTFSVVPNDDLEVIFKHLTEPMIKLQLLD